MILPRRFIPGESPLPNLDDYEYEKKGVNINYTWYGLDIHPEGDYIYMVQAEGSQRAIDRGLATQWDVGTYNASGEHSAFNVYNRYGCRIRPDDGTSFWSVQSNTGVVTIYKQNLVTPYRLTSLSGSNQTKSITALVPAITSAAGLYVKPDGTRLWISSGGGIVEFSMGIPWDQSVLTYVKTVASIGGADIWFIEDGTRLYTLSNTTIRQYNLGTAWDIDTLPGTADYFMGLTTNTTNTQALAFKPDLSKFYVSDRGGSNNYKVVQYKQKGT